MAAAVCISNCIVVTAAVPTAAVAAAAVAVAAVTHAKGELCPALQADYWAVGTVQCRTDA
jgi:hypothetical protein